MVDLRRLGKIMGRKFAVFFVACAISTVVMLVATLIYDPAAGKNIIIEASEAV